MGIDVSIFSWFLRQIKAISFRAFARQGHATVVNRLNDIVCTHQGRIIQYIFLAGEYHKALKKLIRERQRLLDAGMLPDDPEVTATETDIRAVMRGLSDYLDSGLDEACDNVHRSMIQYFNETRPKRDVEPRVTLKVNVLQDGETCIETFFPKNRHYTKNGHATGSSRVSENTASNTIYETGRRYMSNNLPYEAFRGRYVNPRLDHERTRKWHLLPAFYLMDKSWQKCWSPGTSPEDSCYRSTLVIPVTTWRNTFSKPFLEKLQEKASLANYFGNIKREHLQNPDEAARIIYGYLCFDSVYRGYFIDPLDVQFGYIMADILSLYMFTRHMYTELSVTWNASRKDNFA